MAAEGPPSMPSFVQAKTVDGGPTPAMTRVNASVILKGRWYYFFFVEALVAAALRLVALLDGIGVQISTDAGTRFLPAAKSGSSEEEFRAMTSEKSMPLRGQKSPSKSLPCLDMAFASSVTKRSCSVWPARP